MFILDHSYSCLNWYATSNAKIVCMYVHTSMYMCIECMCVYAVCVHVIMPLCAFVCVCVHMRACVSVCKRELVSTSLLNAMEWVHLIKVDIYVHNIFTPQIKRTHEDTQVIYVHIYTSFLGYNWYTFRCSIGKLCTSNKHNTLIQV